MNDLYIFQILTIVAILAGPILAIQIQQYIQKLKDVREHKLLIFKILMATRANRLSVDHVNALNMIDLAFSKNKKEKLVTEAWEKLNDHYRNGYPDLDDYKDRLEEFRSKDEVAAERSSVLFTNLLFLMSNALGYSFSETYLKNSVYSPIGHANTEIEQERLRRAMIKMFEGDVAIPMDVVGFPEMGVDPKILEGAERSENYQKQMVNLLGDLAKNNEIEQSAPKVSE